MVAFFKFLPAFFVKTATTRPLTEKYAFWSPTIVTKFLKYLHQIWVLFDFSAFFLFLQLKFYLLIHFFRYLFSITALFLFHFFLLLCTLFNIRFGYVQILYLYSESSAWFLNLLNEIAADLPEFFVKMSLVLNGSKKFMQLELILCVESWI